jgi:hypothetical protein
MGERMGERMIRPMVICMIERMMGFLKELKMKHMRERMMRRTM